jgi:hypothetical protein
MKKKLMILMLAILPLLAFKCVTKKMRENFVQVNNQLSQNIYCVPSFDYPDTSLSFINKERILANDSIYYLSSKSSKKLFHKTLCKKDVWDKMIKSDTIQIFVFEEMLLKEKNWNEIVTNKLYLRRLTYSYNDIISDSCRIIVK